MARVARWLHNLLVAWDQFWNAFWGGNPDETISSRVGRHAIAGVRVALFLEKIINFILCDPNHCRNCIEERHWSSKCGDAMVKTLTSEVTSDE